MKMFPKTPLLMLMLSAFVFAPVAMAQSSGDSERPPARAKYKKHDADKDGVVSEAEKQTAKEAAKAKRSEKRQSDLEKYDENADGKINKAEREKMKADKEAEKSAKKAERAAKKAEREAKKAGKSKD